MCEPVKGAAIIVLLGQDFKKNTDKKERPKETLRRLQSAYTDNRKRDAKLKPVM